MINVVLISIPIYQMHLFHIPQVIIHKIDSIITKFLWSRVGVVQKYHLTRLKKIVRFVQKGEWGIIESLSFNLALLVAIICRLFFVKGTSKKIIFGKYIKQISRRSGLQQGFLWLVVIQKYGAASGQLSLGFAVIYVEGVMR